MLIRNKSNGVFNLKNMLTTVYIHVVTQIKAQNTEFLREEAVRQTEEILLKACERARMCGLSLEEMKEMLELVYGGDQDE